VGEGLGWIFNIYIQLGMVIDTQIQNHQFKHLDFNIHITLIDTFRLNLCVNELKVMNPLK
jgi:hypothetical protein